MLENLRNSIR